MRAGLHGAVASSSLAPDPGIRLLHSSRPSPGGSRRRVCLVRDAAAAIESAPVRQAPEPGSGKRGVRCLREPCPLLVEGSERRPAERDLDLELKASPARFHHCSRSSSPSLRRADWPSCRLPFELFQPPVVETCRCVVPRLLVEREPRRSARGRARRVPVARRVELARRGLALERVALGQVEVRLGAGARAGDVAPLAKRSLVREEDEGALDGRARAA